MQKNYYALFLLIMLFPILNTSCSSDDPSEEKKLKVAIDSSHDLSTLQVGDSIFLNFASNIPDSLLKIEPVTDNPVYHQKDGIDYNLSWPSKNRSKLILNKPGTYKLWFKTNNPEKDKSEPIYSDTITFSVVKIETWANRIRTSAFPSMYRFEFYMSIDNGDQQSDNYLQNEKFNTYTATVEGKSHSDKFTIATNLKIHEDIDQNSSMYPFNSEILIRITLQNEDNFITYRNVPLKYLF